MEYTRSHLVCFSPTHASHLVGEAVMRGLFTEQSSETDLTYKGLEVPLVIENTITVIVAPVYGGRVTETAMERLGMVRGEESPAIPVVVYGNRDYEDALRELCDWCVAHGFKPVAGAAFIGEHSYSRPGRPIAAGRPDREDLEVALSLGMEVRRILGNVVSLDKEYSLQVKGNVPYKVKGTKTPQTPLTIEEKCTGCGYCIDICPVNTIRMVNGRSASDAEACIKCCACVKRCPNEARVFDTPFTDMLYENFRMSRKPEVFLLENRKE